MGNLFIAIPAPAGNGAGAAVDVSAFGALKTFTVANTVNAADQAAHVTLELSNEAVPTHWAPIYTALLPGDKTLAFAARWIRAVVSNYHGAGAPIVNLAGNDDGSLSAALTAVAVDVSLLPELKTVHVGGSFNGSVQVEISADGGTTWATLTSFQDPGQATFSCTANRMRVRNPSTGSLPAVNVTATVPGGGGSGGGASSSPSVLALYGNGNNGDHTTAGDETWTTLAGAPGSPVVPGGAEFPFAFFEDLTISPGNSVAVGDLSGEGTFPAVVIFVRGTLTLGAGSRIHVNGGNAADSGNAVGAAGLGRNAITGSSDGGNGALGVEGASAGANGAASGEQPAFSWATMNNLAGGHGGASTGVVRAGGTITQGATVSWPYSLSQAIAVASLLYQIGGGGGGGSGGAATNGDHSGSGGGGGGTLVIFAKKIVAPAGSLQAKGGNGGAGSSTEPGVNQNAGGGGGGCGGTILIVTDETTLVGICDVGGGVGGFPSEGGGNQGTTGNPGAIIAMNPMLGPIPT